MEIKVGKKLLGIIAFIIILTVFTSVTAFADRGNIDVEVVVNDFGGKAMAGLEVTYFNKTMITSRRGNCVFDVLGLAENEVEFMQVYDSNQNYYGGITTNLILDEHTHTDIRPDGNPGVYVADIYYTLNTDVVIINMEVDQGLTMSILSIDYIQNDNELEPEPEPEPENNDGFDPDMEHPDEPDMDDIDRDNGIYLPDNIIAIILGIVVAILLIIIIILIVKFSKKNNS